MVESSSVRSHVLKIIRLIERLGQLGLAMDHELSINLALQSLLDNFNQFVLNFHMNQLEAIFPELLNIVVTAERFTKKDEGALLLVSSSKAPKKLKNKKA
ncbi:hypothetical protein QQP08_024097 [Theobroma cacao]|nr:hypothetical protein QQP08_024097 [Theobroma cacao]